MKRFLPPLAFLLVFAGFLVWWFQPANVVKRRTDALLETAAVPASMSELARTTRGPNIGEFLAANVCISGPDEAEEGFGGTMDRDRLAGLYSSIARYCRQVTFEDPVFESVTIEDGKATVDLTVDALVELPDRRPVDGRQDVTLTWTKSEGPWKLTGFTWSEVKP